MHTELTAEQHELCDIMDLRNHPFPNYNLWAFGSFVFFMAIHHIISPWVFRRYTTTYTKIPWVKQMEWNSRFMSTIHAAVVSILCISNLLTNYEMWKYPVTYASWKTLFTLTFSFGYFLCDQVSMPFYWSGKLLYVFTAHHMIALLCCYFCVVYRVAVFFAIYRLTTELSTPFTNQRWFYRIIGYKPDRRRVNSVTLIFAIFFGITRNFMLIPLWIISYRTYTTNPFVLCIQYVPNLRMFFISCILILDVLNIYWAKKVYRVGWRSAKLLWQADWRTDIHRAKADLCRRLRNIRHRRRTSVPAVCPAEINNHMTIDQSLPGLPGIERVDVDEVRNTNTPTTSSDSTSEFDSDWSSDEDREHFHPAGSDVSTSALPAAVPHASTGDEHQTVVHRVQ